MSTFMIEPGARLAGRYRLDSQVSQTNGAVLWKATDETLARLVAVWTFAEDFPRTSEVVRAARATSRIADSRVTQVFDADDRDATPYVVEEWVAGQSLTDLLAQGPLAPERAAGLVAEAAETLATAHAAGLHHLNLTPGKLIWTVGGAVKVTGIGVDAALRGIGAENPVAADAQGLGRLLYAALTAHWPGHAHNGLPAAPLVGGAPCQPSQIRAGIPQHLNDLACRAAFQAPLGGGPLTSARAIADALAGVPRMVPLPAAPHSAPQPARGTSRRSGEFAAAAAPIAPPRQRPAPSRRERRSSSGGGTTRTVARALVGGLALAVFVGVVVVAWNIGSTMSGGEDPETGGAQNSTNNEQQAELTSIQPASADGYDPPPNGDGEEHGDNAALAIDGDPATGWSTEGYESADFGRLKPGAGLLLDLGQSTEVHELTLNLGSGPANLEILVGDSTDPAELGQGSSPAATQENVSGEVEVELPDPAEGRYVVVWFTSLPQEGSDYRGTINEVELRGKT
ncbi:protein kinase family protein [Streptomonospora sp. S1-112]|uniref:Protein kinase family protein n=1 Tax=Streptomonospora mangrovi TaxID=2883123 RepID=A0A9X3NLQ7_9ACTN|nr:protein kinase family protein [Streptomonospora mangrovi]MDA0565300.1 protein kinase family protein [Streptomonospora mangrovi]